MNKININILINLNLFFKLRKVMDYIHQVVTNLFQNMYYLVSIFTVIVHLFCAIAVIRDLNNFDKRNISPQMMPQFSWILCVLISGIWGLFIYWIMHNSALTQHRYIKY